MRTTLVIIIAILLTGVSYFVYLEYTSPDSVEEVSDTKEVGVKNHVEEWCELNGYVSCDILDIKLSQADIADADIHAFKSSTQASGFYIRLNKDSNGDWGVSDVDGYWLENYEPAPLPSPLERF